MKFVSVNFNPVYTNDFLDIHRYLIKGKWCKIMLRLIKTMFMGLLIRILNASNNTKYVSLSDQKYIIQPSDIDLHYSEFIHEFHYYLFAVKLDSYWFI